MKDVKIPNIIPAGQPTSTRPLSHEVLMRMSPGAVTMSSYARAVCELCLRKKIVRSIKYQNVVLVLHKPVKWYSFVLK